MSDEADRDNGAAAMGGAERYVVAVGAGEGGRRLDQVLAAALPQISRSRLKALILEGRVAGAGTVLADPSRKVKAGERFEVIVPPAAPAVPEPQRIPLEILHEDAALIVLVKPPGLTVHPAPGNPDRTLVNALLAHCGASLSGIGGVARPGIVHRLDKDTSGVMVVAKTDAAHVALSRQFARHSIERVYRAVVQGVPVPREGRIEGAIGRNPRDRKTMAVVARGGKPAVTHYRVLRTFGAGGPNAASLVECRLETGRTHQIRVHMTLVGHPLVGDPAYGRRPRQQGATESAERLRRILVGFKRQALHAAVLGFDHPESGTRLRFEAPPPADMANLIKDLAEAEKTP